MQEEYEIQERVVMPNECGPWGKEISGIMRPAGYKYKVKIRKQTPVQEGEK